MNETEHDLSAHHSKSPEEVKPSAPFDTVITMGGGNACPRMPAKKFIGWISLIKKMNKQEFN